MKAEEKISRLKAVTRPGDRIFRVSREKALWLPLGITRVVRRGPPALPLLVFGFIGLIVLGTGLLALPIATKAGTATNVVDALFTATSAVCVTGLIVVDTGTHWSTFGQIVIAILIQFGGLGFMTLATISLLLARQRITLRQRLLFQASVGGVEPGGVVKVARRIAVFVLAAELVGAIILLLRFSEDLPFLEAGGKAVFHSISAFNNAGFNNFANYQSLSSYASDPVVLGAVAILIITGGIGFVVIADVFRGKRFVRFSLDTKLVLIASASLLALGTTVVLLFEFTNPGTLAGMSLPQKVLDSFFHSVSSRTAGFNVFEVGRMAEYSLLFTALLMFIGGATGSAAGGIKVNTMGLLVAAAWSGIRGKEHAGAFGRELYEQQIYRAIALMLLSSLVVSGFMIALAYTEGFRFIQILFETVSAFGTVGLSTGITPELSQAGRLIITVLMFIGRLGPLTFALVALGRQEKDLFRYTREYVRIG